MIYQLHKSTIELKIDNFRKANGRTYHLQKSSKRIITNNY